MKRRLQPRSSSQQDGVRPSEPSHQGADRLTVEAINARYLHYTGVNWRRSVYRWLKAKGVAVGRRSVRCLLVRESEIERALSGRPSSRIQAAR